MWWELNEVMHVKTFSLATIILYHCLTVLKGKEFPKVMGPEKCALGATTGKTDLRTRSPRFPLGMLCEFECYFATLSLNFQVCILGITMPICLVCTQPNTVPGTEGVLSLPMVFTFISHWSLKQMTCKTKLWSTKESKNVWWLEREREREWEQELPRAYIL